MVKRLNCYPANRKKNEEKKNNRKDFYSFLTPTKAKSIYIIFEEYCQETHQIWSFLAKNEEKKEGRFVVRWKLKKEKKNRRIDDHRGFYSICFFVINIIISVPNSIPFRIFFLYFLLLLSFCHKFNIWRKR